MPKVSVIVPVYNAEKFLNQCLSSITNQTLKDIEIIVINDGSKDNSLKIMEQFKTTDPNRFKIIDTKNNGVGAARNIGLDLANGEFIKFVDADDYLCLNILEKMYNIAKENNVSLVRGNYRQFIGKINLGDMCSWSDIKGNQIIDVTQNKDYIIKETSGIGNKLISRELIGDMRFPEKTKWEDLALMPVLVASATKVYHMDEEIYNYRVNLNTTIMDFIKSIPNILDIIRCVDILEDNFKKRNLDKTYSEQIKSLYILHTLFRVENVMSWLSFPRKKKDVLIESLIGIVNLKYPDWMNNKIIKEYANNNKVFSNHLTKMFKYSVDSEKNYNDFEEDINRIFK